jgi:hypothetical protein
MKPEDYQVGDQRQIETEEGVVITQELVEKTQTEDGFWILRWVDVTD